MHVGLNAQLLSLSETYRSAGINRYIHQLITTLPGIAPDLRLTAYVGDTRFTPPPGLEARYSRLPTGRPSVRILWEQTAQPWRILVDGLDVIHGLAYVLPIVAPCARVVTVHDLSFVRYPQAFRPFNRIYLQAMGRASVRRAHRVIADSESTRRDLIRLWRIDPGQVVVVPLGIEPEFTPGEPDQVEAFRRRRGLPERYLLFVGTLEPRKNVTAVVEAFAAWLRRSRRRDVHLVIAGAKGWYYDAVFARVEALQVQDRVHFAGYVPAAELPDWYRGAEGFVYPSLYEGFGLPPLESMACGTPVITSNTSSLPEVVGDAAILVDPTDVEAIAEAMERLLSDPELRRQLREAGMARARLFSWERTARETVAAYRDALGQGTVDR